jgi:D-glycero-D-manno-heptose 1,7-bisphosphate phosphatase
MTSSTRASSWPLAVPSAVLFDRDGTLVVDVPHNGDPDLVQLVPGAEEAVAAVREAGVATGVVTNQSAVGRGLITREQVDDVAARVDELLGAFGTWAVCPHVAEDGCRCRKPAPGLVLQAAETLGVDPAHCVVIGDIGADVGAARAAGALGVLVPTPVTLPAEIADADVVAADLREAVDLALAHLAQVASRAGSATSRVLPSPEREATS